MQIANDTRMVISPLTNEFSCFFVADFEVVFVVPFAVLFFVDVLVFVCLPDFLVVVDFAVDFFVFDVFDAIKSLPNSKHTYNIIALEVGYVISNFYFFLFDLLLSVDAACQAHPSFRLLHQSVLHGPLLHLPA